MTQLPDKESLSAYIDGELSAREREAIDRLVAESSEAKRELEHFRSLSALIKCLPQEQAPPEFRSRVLQAAELGSLLDEPAGAAPAQSAAATEQSRSPVSAARPTGARKSVWWPAAAILAAAAGLLVMIRFVPMGGGDARVAQNRFASEAKTAGESVGALEEVSSETSEATSDQRSALAASTDAAADRPAMQPGPVSAAAAPPVSAPSDFDDAGELANLNRPQGGMQHLVFDKDLNKARVGEVLSALDTSGEEVVVCRVTVVDIRAGLDSLQVLLMHQNVQRAPDAGRRNGYAADAPRTGPRAGRMMAVYVEATQDQLSDALASLKDEAPFRDQQMHVEKTMKVAMLDESNAELARFRQGAAVEQPRPPAEPLAERESAAAEPLGDTRPAELAESLRDESPAAKPQTLTAREAPTPADENRKRSVLGQSRQFQTEVPVAILEKSAERVEEEAPAAGGQIAKEDAAKTQSPGFKDAESQRAKSNTPIQVLFVLVPAGSAAGAPLKTRAAEPNKPQPTDREGGNGGSPQGAFLFERFARPQRFA